MVTVREKLLNVTVSLIASVNVCVAVRFGDCEFVDETLRVTDRDKERE